MTSGKPLPQISADTRPFWEGCRQHLLKIQRCTGCGVFRWPPGYLCPKCLCSESQWVASQGKGRVYTFAVYHVAYHSGFQEEVPYVVAIVQLAEGPRMMTNIIGSDPGEVYCGMPVEVAWDDVDDKITIPRFRAEPNRVRSQDPAMA